MKPSVFKNDLIKQVEFSKYFKATSWEEYNQLFFDGLAHKYDFLNQISSLGMHQRIKRQAIKNMKIKDHSKVLDVCTGSGDIAIFIAQENPTCHVVGVDMSDKMLAIAKTKAKGLKNIEFFKADALNLPFADHQYDAVMISFGLRNLVDLSQGILELKRVTKKNGIVSNLDLGKPKKGFLDFLYKIYFETFIPFLGRTIFHRNEFNSFQYLPESNKHFPSPDQLHELFKTLGFKKIKLYNFMLGGISQQTAEV